MESSRQEGQVINTTDSQTQQASPTLQLVQLPPSLKLVPCNRVENYEFALRELKKQHVSDNAKSERALRDKDNEILKLQQELRQVKKKLTQADEPTTDEGAFSEEQVGMEEMRVALEAAKNELEEMARKSTETEEKYMSELQAHALDTQVS